MSINKLSRKRALGVGKKRRMVNEKCRYVAFPLDNVRLVRQSESGNFATERRPTARRFSLRDAVDCCGVGVSGCRDAWTGAVGKAPAVYRFNSSVLLGQSAFVRRGVRIVLRIASIVTYTRVIFITLSGASDTNRLSQNRKIETGRKKNNGLYVETYV